MAILEEKKWAQIDLCTKDNFLYDALLRFSVYFLQIFTLLRISDFCANLHLNLVFLEPGLLFQKQRFSRFKHENLFFACNKITIQIHPYNLVINWVTYLQTWRNCRHLPYLIMAKLRGKTEQVNVPIFVIFQQ